MTAEEKHDLMVQKYGEDKVRIMTARIWMLVANLNASLYGIAELEPKRMNRKMKFRFNQLETAIRLFLNTFKASAEPAERELLDSMSFDNVGAMAELMSMIAQIPNSQIDWYIEQCQNLTFTAYNRSQGII